MKEKTTYPTISKVYFQEAEKLESTQLYIEALELYKKVIESEISFSDQSTANFFCYSYQKIADISMQIYKKLSNDPEYLLSYRNNLQQHNIDIKALYLSDASKNYSLIIKQYDNSIKSLFSCLSQKNIDVDNIYTMLCLSNSKLINTAKELIHCKEYELELFHTESKIEGIKAFIINFKDSHIDLVNKCIKLSKKLPQEKFKLNIQELHNNYNEFQKSLEHLEELIKNCEINKNDIKFNSSFENLFDTNVLSKEIDQDFQDSKISGDITELL